MIDLSLMRGVDVDPARRRARAQGGVTWNEYNRATNVYGQATTGGVISTTGVAGLTLGGGLGWLMGKHGLSIDNVTQVEVVTADGQARIVNADDEPDLFWALRGGGGNFGVAASFEFETHPLDVVLGGLLAHPLAAARRGVRHVPPVHQGPARRGHRVLWARARPGRQRHEAVRPPAVPLRGARPGRGRSGAAAGVRAAGHGPRRSRCRTRSSTRCSTTRSRRARSNYWKSAFFTELSDAAVQTMIAAFEAAPSIMSGMVVEHFHGAVCRVDPTATAYPHREPGYNLVLIGQWLDPAETDANVRLGAGDVRRARAVHGAAGPT